MRAARMRAARAGCVGAGESRARNWGPTWKSKLMESNHRTRPWAWPMTCIGVVHAYLGCCGANSSRHTSVLLLRIGSLPQWSFEGLGGLIVTDGSRTGTWYSWGTVVLVGRLRLWIMHLVSVCACACRYRRVRVRVRVSCVRACVRACVHLRARARM